MLEKTGRSLRRFYRELPRWLLLATGFLLVAPAFLGYQAGSSYGPDNTRFLLSALASAQAGILAIVFSVAILGIQLVATRYAPRAISLFTEAPIFLYTFGAFIISIGIDLILLYTVPTPITRQFIALLYFAAGLAVISALSLYEFIRWAPEQSTPEGIINAIRRNLPPEEYRRKTEAYLVDDSRPPHPIHPLYSVATSALSNGEPATAETAVSTIQSITANALTELKVESLDPQKSSTTHLTEPVLKRYLPGIALRALETEEFGIVRGAVDATADLGDVGLESSIDFVATQTGDGFAEMVKDAPESTNGQRLVRRAFHEFGELVTDTSDSPSPSSTNHLLSRLNHWVTVVLFNRSVDEDVYPYPRLLREYLWNLHTVESNLLQHHAEEVGQEPIDWNTGMEQGDVDNWPPIRVLNRWRKVVEGVSRQMFYYYDSNEEYPINEATFRRSWSDYCSEAADSPFPGYGTALTLRMLEVAYVACSFEPGNQERWATEVAEVAAEDIAVVRKAFDEIETRGKKYRRNITIQRTLPEGEQEGFLQRFLRNLNQGTLFHQWTADFREEVNDQYRSLAEHREAIEEGTEERI